MLTQLEISTCLVSLHNTNEFYRLKYEMTVLYTCILCGPGSWRVGLIHFLAEWRKRRLNQDLVSVFIMFSCA